VKLPGVRNYSQSWVVNDDVWTLKFVRNLIDDEKGTSLDGLTDPSLYTIFIRLKQSRLETLMTFFHEFMHAIEYSYELEFAEDKNYTYKEFHDFIHQMEKYLAEFFIQNWKAVFLLFFGVLTKGKDIG